MDEKEERRVTLIINFEALSELKAEQPEIKEENLETEEAPLELNKEAPEEEENKSE